MDGISSAADITVAFKLLFGLDYISKGVERGLYTSGYLFSFLVW